MACIYHAFIFSTTELLADGYEREIFEESSDVFKCKELFDKILLFIKDNVKEILG